MAQGLGIKFSKALKRQRKRLGYSQEQLSERADVSVQHIQRLEGKNPSGVTLFTVAKFAAACEMTICQFLKGF